MIFGKKSGIKNNNRDKYEKIKRLMWIKCQNCGKLVYYKDYKDNDYICPKCSHAFIMTPKQRFDLLFDSNKWEKINFQKVSDDPLTFIDKISYKERLKEARTDTGYDDAIVTADGEIDGIKTTVCVLNGEFMMGSMGRSVGNCIIESMEHAINLKNPFIMVTCSGGARMQENILSLMQMARTTVAVNKLHKFGIPYIVLLTDPTFGGVSASFAMLGDVIVTEPNALIAFAGPRVIEQTVNQKLPKGFQRAEFLLEHGMVDVISERKDLKETIYRIIEKLI